MYIRTALEDTGAVHSRVILARDTQHRNVPIPGYPYTNGGKTFLRDA